MILGYEQPVDIPVMSIYDKDMMKMYINSLQKEYERGIADQKEMINMFGNFTSPIAADMDAWNERTLAPLQQMMASAQAQGVDLLRSQEGRMMLANFRNSIPYADMAKLRQSAENAKKYQDLAREMQAKGLYSKDLLDFLGTGDINTWNTLKDGMWNTLSPTEFKDLNQLTSHWFDNLQGSYLGVTPDGKYDRFGVTDEQMNPIVDSYINGFLNSDLGRFYLNQQGGDIDKLRRSILTANKERKFERRDTNDYAKSNYENNQQIGRMKMQRDWDLQDKRDDRDHEILLKVASGDIDPNVAKTAYPHLSGKIDGVTKAAAKSSGGASSGGAGGGSGADITTTVNAADEYYYTQVQQAAGTNSPYTPNYVAKNVPGTMYGVYEIQRNKLNEVAKRHKNSPSYQVGAMHTNSGMSNSMFATAIGKKAEDFTFNKNTNTEKTIKDVILVNDAERSRLYSTSEAADRIKGAMKYNKKYAKKVDTSKVAFMRHEKRGISYVGEDGRFHADFRVELYDKDGNFIGHAYYNAGIQSIKDSGVTTYGPHTVGSKRDKTQLDIENTNASWTKAKHMNKNEDVYDGIGV